PWEAGSYVYVDDVRVLKHVINRDYWQQVRSLPDSASHCHFYWTELVPEDSASGGQSASFWWAFAFRKNSTLRPAFSAFLKRLDQHGILQFLHTNTTPPTQVCELPRGFKDRPLENKDFYATYVITVLGALLASVAFCTEHGYR
ncbi:Ionotropic receptor 76b, partial [Hyalella azteca]